MVRSSTCESAGCNREPFLASWQKEGAPRTCLFHDDSLSWKCDIVGCGNRAKYLFQIEKTLEKRPWLCKAHKLEGMICCMTSNQKRKEMTCEHTNCTKRPWYNYPRHEGAPRGRCPARFCGDHKLEGMIGVYSQCCEHVACSKQGRFNFALEKGGGRFCNIHKLDGMIDIYRKSCGQSGCGKRATHRDKGKGGLYFCAEHKLEGMLPFDQRVCEQSGCTNVATCRYPAETKPRFCPTHKLAGMLGTHPGQRCKQDGCNRIAKYSNADNHKHRFCAMHKHAGMVHRNGNCVQDGCQKSAWYSNTGKKPALFCASHKLEGMRCVIIKTTKKTQKHEQQGIAQCRRGRGGE